MAVFCTEFAPSRSFAERFPDTRVLGFTGFASAGKTTAAKILASSIPGTRVMSFAEPLRAVCKQVFPLVAAEYFDDPALKNTVIPGYDEERLTGRKILQHIGTEGFRALDPNVWIRLADYRIFEAALDGAKLIVFDDVRFENEAALISKYGPVVRIERPGLAAGAHASERAVTDIPCAGVVLNDSDLDAFVRRVLAGYAATYKE